MQAVSLIAKKKYFVHQVRYLEGYFLCIYKLVLTYDITATMIWKVWKKEIIQLPVKILTLGTMLGRSLNLFSIYV